MDGSAGPQTLETLRHAFHLLLQSKLRLAPARTRVEAECGDSPEVARLLRFIDGSERGFVR